MASPGDVGSSLHTLGPAKTGNVWLDSVEIVLAVTAGAAG